VRPAAAGIAAEAAGAHGTERITSCRGSSELL
jgi:hypothetical protein